MSKLDRLQREIKVRGVIRKRLGVSAFVGLLLVLILAVAGLLFPVPRWYVIGVIVVMLFTFGLFVTVIRHDTKTDRLKSDQLMEGMRIMNERVETFRNRWDKS